MSYHTCYICKKRILLSPPKAKSFVVEQDKAFHLECLKRSRLAATKDRNNMYRNNMYRQEVETPEVETPETPAEETETPAEE